MNDREPVYIGMTASNPPSRRATAHLDKKRSHIFTGRFCCRRHALDVEAFLISKTRPKYNRMIPTPLFGRAELAESEHFERLDAEGRLQIRPSAAAIIGDFRRDSIEQYRESVQRRYGVELPPAEEWLKGIE